MFNAVFESGNKNFSATFENENSFDATFESENSFDANFSNTIVIEKIVGDVYEGEYVVAPMPFQEQVLETRAKTMEQDVHVKEIPYFETTNIQNGYTVYIGSEV